MRRTRLRSPTIRTTAWPVRSGPRTPTAAWTSPRGFAPAPSGSTRATPWTPLRRSAASSPAATVASWAERASTATPKPSRSPWRQARERDSVTTVQTREPAFARPVATHRGRIYLGVALWTTVVFLGMTIGVELGMIAPTFTSDVVANLLFGVPVMLVPLALLWNAPGENRSRLDKAAELTLFYLPYTAFSQLGYELMFLIGHPLGWWKPTSAPGWKWLWWQSGLADT